MAKLPGILFALMLIPALATPTPAQPPLAQGTSAATAVAQQATGDTDEPDASSVLIKDIIIEGNTVIDTAALQKIVAPYKNTQLTIDDMGALTDLLTMAYQDAGYLLARAYLPEQEITDGIGSGSKALP
jgi:hemolysin activation/secretion protein